jgi:hypothetical protein
MAGDTEEPDEDGKGTPDGGTGEQPPPQGVPAVPNAFQEALKALPRYQFVAPVPDPAVVAAKAEAAAARLRALREGLEAALANSAEARIEERGENLVLANAWNDAELEIHITDHDSVPNRAERLVELLRGVRLLPAFMAIRHVESEAFETPYSAVPERSVWDIAFTMRFTATRLPPMEIACRLGPSSEAMMLLVDAVEWKGRGSIVNTKYGEAFNIYRGTPLTRWNAEKYDGASPEDRRAAISFWIDTPVEEAVYPELIRNLNFYFSAFYRQHTPIRVFEEPPAKTVQRGPAQPRGDVPDRITGRIIAPYVLQLWESAELTNDPFRRFLHFFQIVEHGARNHLLDTMVTDVRAVLSDPARDDRLYDVVADLVRIARRDRRDDQERTRQAIKARVTKPELVWVEVKPNLAYFAEPIAFDGGLTIELQLGKRCTQEDFLRQWGGGGAFASALIEIRNGLAHGGGGLRDQALSPSHQNARKLEPWLGPLREIATQMVLNADLS